MLQAIVMPEIVRQPVLVADIEIQAGQLIIVAVGIGDRDAIVVLAVCRSGQVRQRIQLQIVQRDGIEAAGRNDVIGKGVRVMVVPLSVPEAGS